jgi:putative SOS response-associated peptidase YedK
MTLTTAGFSELKDLLAAEADPEDEALYRPRYNVAPTDRHWIVRLEGDRRRLEPAKWGVVAGKNPSVINARSETVTNIPHFREAFRERRCVVPADGFYEWTGPKNARRPIWFHAPSGLLLLAGLYTEKTPGEKDGRAFTVLTTRANARVAPVHDRMPVVLSRDAARSWLASPTKEVLEPPPADALLATEVSPRANSVKNDDPSLLEPAPAARREDEQLPLF